MSWRRWPQAKASADPVLDRFFSMLAPQDGARAVCLSEAGLGPDGRAYRPGKPNMCDGVPRLAELALKAQRERLNCWVTTTCFTGAARTAKTAVDGRIIAVDVDPKEGYFTDKDEARSALRAAVEGGCIKPSFVVDSGNGLHLWYWFEHPFDVAFGKESDWAKASAFIYGQLGQANPNFLADTSRRADAAGLFRMPGTFNMKDASDPKPIVILPESTGVTIDPALVDISRTFEDGKKSIGRAPAYITRRRSGIDGIPLREELHVEDFGAVIANCVVLQEYERSLAATVPYDPWYKILGWTTCADNGRDYAHRLSAAHGDYAPETVDYKFDNLSESNDRGIAPCRTVAAELGLSHLCQSCDAKLCNANWPHKHPALKEPRTATTTPEDTQTPETPSTPVLSDPTTVSVDPTPLEQLMAMVPPAMRPGGRAQYVIDGVGQTTAMGKVEEDGSQSELPMLDHAAWAERFVWNTTDQRYNLLFRAARVRGDKVVVKNIEVPLRAITTDWTALIAPFADQGIAVPVPGPSVKDKFAKFVAREQVRVRDVDEAGHTTAMGWQKSGGFSIGGDTITPTGGTVPSVLAGSALVHAQRFMPRGSHEFQREVLKLYDEHGSDIAKFVIMLAAGSPAQGIAGYGSPLTVLTGTSGAGKTALCRFAASLWYNPQEGLMTPRDTTLAIYENVGVLNNLPAVLDEVTFRETVDLAGMVHALSAGGNRSAMDRTGSLRARTATWAGAAFWTTNRSLVQQLAGVSYENDAVAYRLMELDVDTPTLGVSNRDSLAVLNNKLPQNYGHVGVELARTYAAERSRIEALHEQSGVTAAGIVPGGLAGQLRYWAQNIQVALTGAALLNEKGYMMLDQERAAAIAKRLTDTALLRMTNARRTSDDILRQYLNQHTDKTVMIVFEMKGKQTTEPVIYTPMQAVARVEAVGDKYKVQVLKAQFNRWLGQNQCQVGAVLAGARESGMVRGEVEVMADIYAGAGRMDRNGSMVSGFVEAEVYEFWIDRKRNEVADAKAPTAGGDNVVPLRKGDQG